MGCNFSRVNFQRGDLKLGCNFRRTNLT
ncbi:MAG: pentapeptide repeat-containing protein [Acutalibacteraceae bacterium]